jgi:hypothetical protein
MHVEHSFAATALVKVIHVLGDKSEVFAKVLFQCGESAMSGIRLDLREIGAAHVVKIVHKARIALIALGCGHIFDAMPLPQSIGGAESGHS